MQQPPATLATASQQVLAFIPHCHRGLAVRFIELSMFCVREKCACRISTSSELRMRIVKPCLEIGELLGVLLKDPRIRIIEISEYASLRDSIRFLWANLSVCCARH